MAANLEEVHGLADKGFSSSIFSWMMLYLCLSCVFLMNDFDKISLDEELIGKSGDSDEDIEDDEKDNDDDIDLQLSLKYLEKSDLDLNLWVSSSAFLRWVNLRFCPATMLAVLSILRVKFLLMIESHIDQSFKRVCID